MSHEQTKSKTQYQIRVEFWQQNEWLTPTQCQKLAARPKMILNEAVFVARYRLKESWQEFKAAFKRGAKQ